MKQDVYFLVKNIHIAAEEFYSADDHTAAQKAADDLKRYAEQSQELINEREKLLSSR